MATHDIRKKISFKCHTCQSKAQCMEVDGQQIRENNKD